MDNQSMCNFCRNQNTCIAAANSRREELSVYHCEAYEPDHNISIKEETPRHSYSSSLCCNCRDSQLCSRAHTMPQLYCEEHHI